MWDKRERFRDRFTKKSGSKKQRGIAAKKSKASNQEPAAGADEESKQE